ncbi:Frataxin [Cristinia sonorae]|uniref:ferroxidase n=1 Tax=Cristinia sonorae TaxID=1940300 RepID=A0A8K0XQ09_9AGAR|nr:Frataxin [Cristinia sonorae]
MLRTTRRPASTLLKAAPSLAGRSVAKLSWRSQRVLVQPSSSQWRRHYATPPPQVKHSDLSTNDYHKYADWTMDQLVDTLEVLLDGIGNPHYELEYNSGVLTLNLHDKGTYVINKQPPNKQIWLSSPVSGPKRYDYIPEQDDWVYSRESQSLGDLLNEELSSALGKEIDLAVRDISKQ